MFKASKRALDILSDEPKPSQSKKCKVSPTARKNRKPLGDHNTTTEDNVQIKYCPICRFPFRWTVNNESANYMCTKCHVQENIIPSKMADTFKEKFDVDSCRLAGAHSTKPAATGVRTLTAMKHRLVAAFKAQQKENLEPSQLPAKPSDVTKLPSTCYTSLPGAAFVDVSYTSKLGAAFKAEKENLEPSQLPAAPPPKPSAVTTVPSTCMLCYTTFDSADDLKEHKIIHENTKSKKCGKCGEEFTKKREFTKHLKSHLYYTVDRIHPKNDNNQRTQQLKLRI